MTLKVLSMIYLIQRHSSRRKVRIKLLLWLYNAPGLHIQITAYKVPIMAIYIYRSIDM